MQRVKAAIPSQPGIYEWGALPPNGKAPHDIVAFYVGKAGSHATASSQTLATRFVRSAPPPHALHLNPAYLSVTTSRSGGLKLP